MKEDMEINWTYILEHRFEKIAGIVAFVIISSVGIFMSYIGDMWSGLFAGIPFAVLIGVLIGVWGGADDYYEYQLKGNELTYTKQQRVPESIFTIVRVFSYFGIVVCIVAAVVLGPLAFAGAGAMALMSVKLANIKPQYYKNKIEIAEKYVIKHVKDKEDIYLFSKSGNSRRQSGEIYCEPEYKIYLLDELTKRMKEYEVVEVNHWREV